MAQVHNSKRTSTSESFIRETDASGVQLHLRCVKERLQSTRSPLYMEDSLMSRTFEEQHLFEIEIVICNIIHLILLSHYTVYFQVMVKRHQIDLQN